MQKKLEKQIRNKELLELSECTFRPKINKKVNSEKRAEEFITRFTQNLRPEHHEAFHKIVNTAWKFKEPIGQFSELYESKTLRVQFEDSHIADPW